MTIEIRICCGMNCLALGGQELLDVIEDDPSLTDVVSVDVSTCLEACEGGKRAPVVEVEGKTYLNMSSENLLAIIRENLEGESG